MRAQRTTISDLRSRVSARHAVWRDRRNMERYLDETSPAARRELEIIFARHDAGRDF